MKVGYTGNYTWRHNDENLASIGGTGWWNSAIYLSPTIKPMDDYNPFYYSGQKINTPLATILLNTNYQALPRETKKPVECVSRAQCL